nr:hypothetical protein [Tanacetum cinerariifolium]
NVTLWLLNGGGVCVGGSGGFYGGGGAWCGGVDGGQRGKGRVRESGVKGRIDREIRSIFGFVGKIPPEKFSGGGRVVAGGG